jgi:hypothetical protein
MCGRLHPHNSASTPWLGSIFVVVACGFGPNVNVFCDVSLSPLAHVRVMYGFSVGETTEQRGRKSRTELAGNLT